MAGDIKVQTERVLQNVKAILDDQQLTFTNVVKSTVFLTNLADFAGMNEIYSKYFTSRFSGAFRRFSCCAAQRRERGYRVRRHTSEFAIYDWRLTRQRQGGS